MQMTMKYLSIIGIGYSFCGVNQRLVKGRSGRGVQGDMTLDGGINIDQRYSALLQNFEVLLRQLSWSY